MHRTLVSGIVGIVIGAIVGYLLGWFAVCLTAIASFFAECMTSTAIGTLIGFALAALAIYGIYKLLGLLDKNGTASIAGTISASMVLIVIIVVPGIGFWSRMISKRSLA